MKRLLFYPAVVVFAVVAVHALYSPECTIPQHLTELISYRYRDWKPPKRARVSFNFRDVGEAKASKKVTDYERVVENMKLSIVEGKREFLLVEGFFIPKGAEYNGIRFLGVKDGEVYIEIKGRVYKRRL